MVQAPVYFENGFKKLDTLIAQNLYTKIAILVDEHTHSKCLPILLKSLERIDDVEFIEVPAGEGAKQLFYLNEILKRFSDMGMDRKSLLINLGGGVVTDLGGFAAAIYKRGIDFVNIPTSLLAMVDASAGGKTGIDHYGIKNQIGSFSQPKMVIIEPSFLKTLPAREITSGFAEMLKHGLIQSVAHWQDLIKIQALTVEQIAPFIKDSVSIKINIVEQDPTEKGLRKILNAGHTIGHAIETYFLNKEVKNSNAQVEKTGCDVYSSISTYHEPIITHGEAIAAGLILESHLAHQKKLLNQEEMQSIFKSIARWFPYIAIPELDKLTEIMLHDKKNEKGKIKFVMLNAIGNCNPLGVECSPNEIQKAIDYYEQNYPKQ